MIQQKCTTQVFPFHSFIILILIFSKCLDLSCHLRSIYGNTNFIFSNEKSQPIFFTMNYQANDLLENYNLNGLIFKQVSNFRDNKLHNHVLMIKAHDIRCRLYY